MLVLFFVRTIYPHKTVLGEQGEARGRGEAKGGSKGSKGGAVVRALAFHQCSPGSNPSVDAICGLIFCFGSLPCSERFFSGNSGFPLSSKTNISKFQFDQESGRRRTTMWMCYLQIVIYLFIYLFIYLLSRFVY